MCNDLIVHFPFSKTLWFSFFLIKFDEPFIKLQIFLCTSDAFLMHFLCASDAFFMHFLCTSYALFMHFVEVHKKCIRNACNLNQRTCTSYALL